MDCTRAGVGSCLVVDADGDVKQGAYKKKELKNDYLPGIPFHPDDEHPDGADHGKVGCYIQDHDDVVLPDQNVDVVEEVVAEVVDVQRDV